MKDHLVTFGLALAAALAAMGLGALVLIGTEEQQRRGARSAFAGALK